MVLFLTKENKELKNEVIVAAEDDDQSCMTGTLDVADGNNGDLVMKEKEPHTPVRKASHHSGQNIADNDEEDDERHVKVRKIATSISSPAYKGKGTLVKILF